MLRDFRIYKIITWTGIKILFIFFLLTFNDSNAQWVSNPEKNTLFVTNCFNPVNISSVDDLKGGLFVFWEDNLTGFQSEISFVHINGDGIASFRTDGKKVSASVSPKSNPVCTPALPNSSYVVWKEISGYTEHLIAQRVSTSGTFFWNQYGVKVSKPGDLIGDYSAASDNKGKLFVSYIPREADNEEYAIRMQGLTPEGRNLFRDIISVSTSENKKSSIYCLPDAAGGVNIFWIENINQKSVLVGQNINSAGKSGWGVKPVVISNTNDNVFSFTAKNYSTAVYVVWQTQKSDKDIYQQMIGPDGKMMWQRNGIQIVPSKGNQTNPQSIINDKEILLTWTDENNGDRNIYMQKFGSKGEKIWSKNTSVINLKGDQFGQRILSDGKKGAIVTWIDRRVNTFKANIYAQRINASGMLEWDSLGVSVASSRNTEKSYISVIPDVTGGAVVVFKEKRDGKNEIFGQKIFNTGTFISQIIAFNTELIGDSVKISWYSANEQGPGTFLLERTTESDTSETTWQRLSVVESDGKAAAKYFELFDKPEESGTIYYRVVHSDRTGNMPSDLAKINYLKSETNMFVSQNSPNPFKDKTVFGIYLPEASDVKIEFFDSHLEKIKEIDKHFPAGRNDVEFTAYGLKPGIYFYKVYADNFVDVKKMVIAN